jgi:hypothetical protein
MDCIIKQNRQMESPELMTDVNTPDDVSAASSSDTLFGPPPLTRSTTS